MKSGNVEPFMLHISSLLPFLDSLATFFVLYTISCVINWFFVDAMLEEFCYSCECWRLEMREKENESLINLSPVKKISKEIKS